MRLLRFSETERRLWSYARQQLGRLRLAAVVLLLYSVLEPVMLWLAKGVSKILADGMTDLSGLNQLVVLMVGLGVLLALTEFGHVFLIEAIGQTMAERIRGDLFRRIQSLSLSFFDEHSTGGLMSNATNDMSTFQARLNSELARLIKCPVAIVGLLTVMLCLSWRLTLWGLLMLVVLGPLLAAASRLMKRHTQTLQERLSDLSARLQENISSMRVVQCFGAGERETERFLKENADVRRAGLRTVRVRAGLQPIIHVVGLVGLLIVIWLGTRELLVAKRIDASSLLVLVGSLQLITTNFKQFGRARVAWAEVNLVASRIFTVIDTEPDIVDRPDAVELTTCVGRVTYRDVEFAYRPDKPVLQGIDLELLPGEAVAVIGPSGSGKSTLANLLPRLYDVTGGAVLIDGHDVRELTLASLRSHIGIVPQETVLFRGTIAENIAYGRPEASLEEIVAAARAANADQFISSFPEGYETRVGERGKTLSGGEAQRVAIARALLKDPTILILDEATSSLDSENEALVQEALERLMENRTTLVIAHRLSTIYRCQRIVVLRDGRIVEQGSHAELLAEGGAYARAVMLQGGDYMA